MTAAVPASLDEKLQRVTAFEHGRRTTVITRLLKRVGPTRAFAAVYRRLGPAVDPWLIRKTDGQILTRWYGFPALLLATTGAKSGQRRVQPVIYLRDGRDFAIVGTNFGQTHHPGWTANLLAHPQAEVEVGPVTLAVTAELADSGTWERLWPNFVEVYPGYASYLSRTGGRKPRMFVLHPLA
jgi:deazaflavin-dependent oxidoreductase (nitroreductase family)